MQIGDSKLGGPKSKSESGGMGWKWWLLVICGVALFVAVSVFGYRVWRKNAVAADVDN